MVLLRVTFTELPGPRQWLRHLRKELGPRPLTWPQSVTSSVLSTGLLQQPSIQVSDPMVREKENKVVMTCITNEMDITVKWIFNKQQLKSAKNVFLSEDSKNLTIDPIKKENAGDYQCEISNIGTSNRSETFELKVKGK